MQAVSALWRDYFDSGAFNFEYRLTIAGTEYRNDMLFDLSLTGALCDAAKLSIGNCCMRELSFTLKNGYADIPRRAQVLMHIRLNGDRGPTEWLKKGEFFVDQRTKGTDGTRFVCADRIIMMSEHFINNAHSDDYPMQMSEAVDIICGRVGLELDNPEAIPPYGIEYPNEMSMREVAGHIASAGGGNFMVTDTGKLRLVVPRNADPVFAAPQKVCHEINDMHTISKVTMLYGHQNGFQDGDDSGREIAVHNPWATQEMCAGVFARLRGYTHRPYTASGVFADPAIELGDSISLIGFEAVTIFSADIRFGGDVVWSISAPGESALEHEFPYQGQYAREMAQKVTLGEPYEGVVISRRDGIVIRYTDGSAEVQFKSGSIAMRALVNGVMQDVLYFDSGKQTYVFDGKLTANVIETLEAVISPVVYTGALYADNGSIANLTVNALRTDYKRVQRYLAGDTSPLNYITLHDEVHRMITAETDGSQTEQFSNMDGQLLWWRDNEIGGTITTEQTDTPVMVYVYSELEKYSNSFSTVTLPGGDTAVTPVAVYGAGTGQGDNGKLFVWKAGTSAHIQYVTTSGVMTELRAEDDGKWYYNDAEIGGGGHVLLDHEPDEEEAESAPKGSIIHVFDRAQERYGLLRIVNSWYKEADSTVIPEPPQEPEPGEGFITLTVNSGTDSSFILPTTGRSSKIYESPGTGYQSYNWIVDWGDGTSGWYSGTGSENSGITHTYPQAKTLYTIGIKPQNESEAGWLKAFGLGIVTPYPSAGAQSAVNKAKMRVIDGQLTEHMIRSSPEENDVCRNMFTACSYLTMGDTFQLPQNITSCGDYFCSGMFSYCSSLTMNSIFQLPPLLTNCGIEFCSGMFYINTALTLNDVFRQPQNMTTFGEYYFRATFEQCKNITTKDVKTFFGNRVLSAQEIGGAYTKTAFRGTFNTCPGVTETLAGIPQLQITPLVPTETFKNCPSEATAGLHSYWYSVY